MDDGTSTEQTPRAHRSRARQGSSRQLWRTYLTMLSPLVLMTFAGAVPIEKGRTMTVGTGCLDQEVYQGCSSPPAYVKGAPLYGSYQQRFENNVVISADASATALDSQLPWSHGEGGAISENGAYLTGSFRLGYGGEHGGIELGPSFRWTSLQDFDVSYQPLLWSLSFWAGRPDRLYFFGRSLAGYESPQFYKEIGMLGLGQKRSWIEAEVSIPWWLPVFLFELDSPSMSQPAVELHVGLRTAPRFWVAMDLGIGPYDSYAPHTDIQALLSLSWRPEVRAPIPRAVPGAQPSPASPTVGPASVPSTMEASAPRGP